MFILKKIVAELFLPLPISLFISLVGLVLLWFTRRQKAGKIFVSAGIFLLLITSHGLVFNLPLKSLEKRYPALLDFDLITDIPWVVVLGGGHNSDPDLPVTGQISSASLARLVEGIRLKKNLPGSRLVLSGSGVFDPISNARIMADVASILDINENEMVLEPNSRDTEDEARLIAKIVKDDKFVLVTSASHMPRAMLLFEKLGLHPIPAPTEHRIKQLQGFSPGYFFPDSGQIRNAELVSHELLGLLWSKIRGRI